LLEREYKEMFDTRIKSSQESLTKNSQENFTRSLLSSTFSKTKHG
jgi:hypothetical protein